MNDATHLEHSASSSRSKHEGESSFGLCDRLSRTRDNSQRQLPTDHDYAVSTREYQTDQSSLKPAQAAARSVLGKQRKQRQKQIHRSAEVDTVTPYQADALIEIKLSARRAGFQRSCSGALGPRPRRFAPRKGAYGGDIELANETERGFHPWRRYGLPDDLARRLIIILGLRGDLMIVLVEIEQRVQLRLARDQVL